MKRLTFLLVLLCFWTSTLVNATEITVPGISGITFDDAVPSVSITSDFTIHGLNVSPDGLTLSYASDVFKLYGSAKVKLGTDEITVSFGTEASPGLEVTSGTFDKVSVGLTADFNLKSLGFAPNGLSFEWDNSNNVFEIYGAAVISFDSESMTVSLGDAATPGIEISNGGLTKVNLGVSADFSLKNLSFKPNALTFQWDSTTDKFEMFGGADVSFDSESMTIGLGEADTPGIEINGGTVEKVNLSVSADFNLKSLSFKPNGLTFQWDSTTKNFEMFGGADVSFDSETMTVGLGDADAPGIEINGGTVQSVNLSVSADFNLKSLSFKPNGLTFQWDSTTKNFEMFGGADVSFDSETMTVGLGDADTPGIEINGGTVQSVNLSVSADFNLKSLSFKPNGLTFQWDSTTKNFEMFGGADVSFDSETMTIGLGDADTPGIEINGGTVQSVNLSVSADFNLKSLSFKPNGLTFQWDSTTKNFEMFGGADVSFDSETMTVGLGDSDTPGIEINGGTVQSVNLSVSADFNLKSLSFKPTGLTFQWDSTTKNFEMFGLADVSFDSETMSIGLGDADTPGIEVNGGTVEKINLSVSAEFSMKSLVFTPQGLTFQWDSTTKEFEMFGDADVTFDSEVVMVGLGNADNPGIALTGSTVSQINFSVSADFNIKGLGFAPDNLTFQWKSGSDDFIMFGGATTTFNNESITVGLGDESSPGIEIASGRLSKLNMGLTADFTLRDLTFAPNNLTFAWDSTTDNFEMYGGATVSFDSETVTVGMGNATSPGIEIEQGNLKKINLSVSADFDVKSLTFAPDNLTFEWDSAMDDFGLYGAASVSFDSETVSMSMGDADFPGIEVNKGDITKINMGVSADFNMRSLSFAPDDLTFKWDSSSDDFQMFGAATLGFDGQTIDITMGDEANPGLAINAGKLKSINLGITADFDMKGVSFAPNGLTFQWNSGNNFVMFGSATASFTDASIEVLMGDQNNPGVSISNGNLQSINLGITADFKVKSMEFEAQGLTFSWDRQANRYEIYGSTSAKFAGEEIAISLGNASSPGIAVRNKTLLSLNMGVTANFNLKAMTFKPQNLTFHYDRNQNRFEMYGSAMLSVEGNDATISMGTNANPGLVFSNNRLDKINVSITSNFSLKGLTVKTNNVGVSWDRSTDYFNFYGGISLELGGQSLSADMGNANNPGMQFRNGRLHSFDVVINSNFRLGGLEVTTKDVEVNYSSNRFYIAGRVEINQLWSVAIELGQNNTSGLEINLANGNNSIKLDNFKIEIEHIDLGAIDFKRVAVSFQNGTISSAELMVAFPPGYEVGASMTFVGNPARINSIDIAFEATSFSTSIPVGNTGIQVVRLSGGMYNLADPSRRVPVNINGQIHYTRGVYFRGSVAFTFGGPFSLAGRQAALIYNRNDAVITASEANLTANLLIGAYRQGTNNWRGLLGEGSINMNLQWGRSYSISAFMKIPADPLVEFRANAKLAQSGNFDALLSVKLKVPKKVPIVGGKTLGSVSGGMHFNPRNINSSYAAGWASYKFFGRHYFGARYKFGSRKVDIIGSGTISGIKREIGRAIGGVANMENSLGGVPNYTNSFNVPKGAESVEWVKDIRTFELPPNKSSMFVEVDFGKTVDVAFVSVFGPDGFYDIYEIEKTEVAEDEPPQMVLKDQQNKFEQDSALNFLIVTHEPELDEAQHQFTTMAPGQYEMLISYPATNEVDSVGVNVNYFHPESLAEIDAQKLTGGLINLDLNYWAAVPDSTLLRVYWNDTAEYSGHHIATLDYGQADKGGFGSTNVVFNTNQSVDGDSIYFYYVLQDSTNAPLYSSFTKGFEHVSPVSGIVEVTNSNEEEIQEGIMLFLDVDRDGFYDTQTTQGAYEPQVVTDENGAFHFNDLVMGQTYDIDMVLPFGFSFADGETGVRTFTYEGFALEFNFRITKD